MKSDNLLWIGLVLLVLFMLALWHVSYLHCDDEQMQIMLKQKHESEQSGTASWTSYEESYLRQLQESCGCD